MDGTMSIEETRRKNLIKLIDERFRGRQIDLSRHPAETATLMVTMWKFQEHGTCRLFFFHPLNPPSVPLFFRFCCKNLHSCKIFFAKNTLHVLLH